MEKKIELVMEADKSIKILVDGKGKKSIPSENRKITADEIYNLLNYTKGDTYTIEKKNAKNLDVQVLDFFLELMVDIVKQVNTIK